MLAKLGRIKIIAGQLRQSSDINFRQQKTAWNNRGWVLKSLDSSKRQLLNLDEACPYLNYQEAWYGLWQSTITFKQLWRWISTASSKATQIDTNY